MDLEEDIIRKLDYDLLVPFPTLFLERYQRIFGLDKYQKSKTAAYVNKLARHFCNDFLKLEKYLSYKPSQVAAVSLLMAMNIYQSKVSEQLKLTRIEGVRKKFFYKNFTMPEDPKMYGPLAEWNDKVEELTRLPKRDLARPYMALYNHLNTEVYENLLDEDQSLSIRRAV